MTVYMKETIITGLLWLFENIELNKIQCNFKIVHQG